MIKILVQEGKQITMCNNCGGPFGQSSHLISVNEPLLIIPDGVDFEGLKDKYIKIVDDTFTLCKCGNTFLKKDDKMFYVGTLASENEDDVKEWLRRSAKRYFYRYGERSTEYIVLMKDGELYRKHMSSVDF